MGVVYLPLDVVDEVPSADASDEVFDGAAQGYACDGRDEGCQDGFVYWGLVPFFDVSRVAEHMECNEPGAVSSWCLVRRPLPSLC